MSEQDKKYNSLMKYLRQLKREGAEFLNWLPEYEMVDGKETGKFWITIHGKEKES